MVDRRPLDVSFNGNAPGTGFEVPGCSRRLILVGSKLVKVVVGRGVFIIGPGFVSVVGTFLALSGRVGSLGLPASGEETRGDSQRSRLDELAAVEVSLFRSNF